MPTARIPALTCSPDAKMPPSPPTPPSAAATCMGVTAAAFTTPADWHFPHALVLPLIYWIIVCSVAGYYVVTWATRHLPASQVGGLGWARRRG